MPRHGAGMTPKRTHFDYKISKRHNTLMTQNDALAILKTGANVFLTGEPGSGKTHTVNEYVAWLRAHDMEPAVTASTGIAATHVNGYTIHSWSGIGVKRSLSRSDVSRIESNKRVANRIRSAHVLVIDEISMLSAQTFALAETACRMVRGSVEPFGGLQVVLVGDFFQLPPVVTREEAEEKGHERIIFEDGEDAARSVFAFNAPAWRSLGLTVCYLSEQHRQEDVAFLDILSAIRSQNITASHRALLETRLAPHGAENVTQFFAHNAQVDLLNSGKLSRLMGEAHAFKMESRGPKDMVERLKKGCLSPETLMLKVGARVMFTKNDIPQHRFVNGTLGVVTGFSESEDGGEGSPIVETNAGRTIFVERADWNIEENGRILAGISQMPLRLAWAITVHKSQGMSLDAAHMDLSDAFEHGQGYVAISRVRTLAGLSLAGFNERALEVHPEIALKDAEFRNASRGAGESIADLSPEELLHRHHEFIRSCGGKIEEAPPPTHAKNEKFVAKAHLPTGSPQKYSVANMREKYPSAYQPWGEGEDADLARRIEAGETVREISAALGRQPGAIRSRLAKLDALVNSDEEI